MAAVAPSRGGSNASTVGMVIAIAVAVLLLGVLIWLFTQQEQLRSTAAQAEASRKKMASDQAEATRNLQTLARALTGNDKDAPQTATMKLESALKKIADDENVPSREQFTSSMGAANVIDSLYQLYSSEHTAREEAEAAREKSGADLKAAEERTAEMQKNFGESLAAITKKVDELQLAKSEFEKLKTSETQALASTVSAKTDALESLRRDYDDKRQRLATEIRNRETLLTEQKVALQNLRGPGASGAQELALARKPIGSVLRALPGDSLVHIDLGRNANVALGMTFSVYSADERVPADGRGKANIEVLSVGELTSECRVVTQPAPDNPILEGDRVGNIVVGREVGKKQRFCIVGAFDIDFDGQPDARGHDAVVSLVTRYGGAVTDRVDAETDYLVIGMAPPVAEDEEAAAPAAKPAEVKEEATEEKPTETPAEEARSEEGAAGEEETATGEEKPEATEEGAEGEEPAEKPAEPGAEKAELPKIEKPKEVDLTEIPRMRRTRSERDQYEAAVRRAEQLAIPRLPLDRFLNFVGIEPGPNAVDRLEM